MSPADAFVAPASLFSVLLAYAILQLGQRSAWTGMLHQYLGLLHKEVLLDRFPISVWFLFLEAGFFESFAISVCFHYAGYLQVMKGRLSVSP